jgi:hypothetical protein
MHIFTNTREKDESFTFVGNFTGKESFMDQEQSGTHSKEFQ